MRQNRKITHTGSFYLFRSGEPGHDFDVLTTGVTRKEEKKGRKRERKRERKENCSLAIVYIMALLAYAGLILIWPKPPTVSKEEDFLLSHFSSSSSPLSCSARASFVTF